MKCEIKIDLPPDVAAKWVPVAVRQARSGDACLYGNNAVSRWQGAESSGRYLILAPRVEWPAWCSADWIAKDADGELVAYVRIKPQWSAEDCQWLTEAEFWPLAQAVHADLYAAFGPVPPDLSLIENPNRIKGVE